MNISVATLCDFAQVREGLLFVSSGNITRVGRSEFPTQVNLHLALSFVVEPAKDQGDYTIEAQVRDQSGASVANTTVNLSVKGTNASDPAVISAVVPVQPVIAAAGDHWVDVSVNASAVISLPLKAAISGGGA